MKRLFEELKLLESRQHLVFKVMTRCVRDKIWKMVS